MIILNIEKEFNSQKYKRQFVVYGQRPLQNKGKLQKTICFFKVTRNNMLRAIHSTETVNIRKKKKINFKLHWKMQKHYLLDHTRKKKRYLNISFQYILKH